MNSMNASNRRVVTGIRASAVLFNYLQALPQSVEKRTWLIPANTCSVLPLTFMRAGRLVDIIDIDPVDLCADVQVLTRRIERNTRQYEGVLLVDTYGYSKDWRTFINWLANHEEIRVIHDKCASAPVHSSEHPKVDLYLYSTGYAKYLDLGYGGFGYLRPGLPFRSSAIPFSPADFKQTEQLCKEALAVRQPLGEFPAAWLDTSPLPVPELAYFEQITQRIPAIAAHKARLNKRYAEQIPVGIQLAAAYQQWRFNIMVPRKDLLLAELFRNKLFASSHYASLAGVFSDRQAPYAEKFAAGVVNLFNDYYYTEEQAALTIELINAHVEQFGLPPGSRFMSDGSNYI